MPATDFDQTDNAAAVRFANGREVRFAPTGQMVKWTPATTEPKKAAARRAYDVAVTENTATPEDCSDA